jgi:hypothetical protein
MVQARNPKDGVNRTTIRLAKEAKARGLQRKEDAVSTKINAKLGFAAPKTKVSPTPKPKAKPTKKPISPRQRIDVSKMTPAQKAAYYAQQGYDNY